MRLGWNGLLTTVNTHKEDAVFAAQGQVATLQAREMQLNPFMVFFHICHHASVNLVVEDLSDSVGANRLR